MIRDCRLRLFWDVIRHHTSGRGCRKESATPALMERVGRSLGLTELSSGLSANVGLTLGGSETAFSILRSWTVMCQECRKQEERVRVFRVFRVFIPFR